MASVRSRSSRVSSRWRRRSSLVVTSIASRSSPRSSANRSDEPLGRAVWACDSAQRGLSGRRRPARPGPGRLRTTRVTANAARWRSESARSHRVAILTECPGSHAHSSHGASVSADGHAGSSKARITSSTEMIPPPSSFVDDSASWRFTRRSARSTSIRDRSLARSPCSARGRAAAANDGCPHRARASRERARNR